jgi:hypothetical protein
MVEMTASSRHRCAGMQSRGGVMATGVLMGRPTVSYTPIYNARMTPVLPSVQMKFGRRLFEVCGAPVLRPDDVGLVVGGSGGSAGAGANVKEA